MSFSRVCLHVKGKFDLGIHIGIVDFEKSVHELFQVDVAIAVQIKDGEKSFSNNSWQLRVLYVFKIRTSKVWESTA